MNLENRKELISKKERKKGLVMIVPDYILNSLFWSTVLSYLPPAGSFRRVKRAVDTK